MLELEDFKNYISGDAILIFHFFYLLENKKDGDLNARRERKYSYFISTLLLLSLEKGPIKL